MTLGDWRGSRMLVACRLRVAHSTSQQTATGDARQHQKLFSTLFLLFLVSVCFSYVGLETLLLFSPVVRSD